MCPLLNIGDAFDGGLAEAPAACRAPAPAINGTVPAGGAPDTLAHALRYADLGLAVLPLHRPVERGGRLVCSCGKSDCSSAAKHPVGALVPRGLLDATRDGDRITSWFEHEPWSVGIATGAGSGIVVLDIDPRHGGDETLKRLEAEHGALPPTWRFLTGGGGEHVVLRHPGVLVKNSAGKIGRGIDVRGDGGYIVAPPSRHISGRAYTISVDHHPDDVPLAPMPAWLLAMVAGRPAPAEARGALGIGRVPTDWQRFFSAPIDEGRRNSELTRFAGHLLGRRLDPAACLNILRAVNATHCRPPLPDPEIVRIVDNIARREYAGSPRPGGGRDQRPAGHAGGDPPPAGPDDPLAGCMRDGRSGLLPNLANAMHVLRRHPSVARCFAYDGMLCAPLLMAPLPGGGPLPAPRPVTDTDVAALQEWLHTSASGGSARTSCTTRWTCAPTRARSTRCATGSTGCAGTAGRGWPPGSPTISAPSRRPTPRRSAPCSWSAWSPASSSPAARPTT